VGWPSSREHQRTVPVNRPVTQYNLIFTAYWFLVMVILRGEGAQDVQICDLIHKSVNWQRPLVLPAWWPPTIWIFYFIIKIELGIPRGSTKGRCQLTDLWIKSQICTSCAPSPRRMTITRNQYAVNIRGKIVFYNCLYGN
jgi:hypothetical protein